MWVAGGIRDHHSQLTKEAEALRRTRCGAFLIRPARSSAVFLPPLDPYPDIHWLQRAQLLQCYLWLSWLTWVSYLVGRKPLCTRKASRGGRPLLQFNLNHSISCLCRDNFFPFQTGTQSHPRLSLLPFLRSCGARQPIRCALPCPRKPFSGSRKHTEMGVGFTSRDSLFFFLSLVYLVTDASWHSGWAHRTHRTSRQRLTTAVDWALLTS